MEERKCLINTRRWLEDEIIIVKHELMEARDEMLIEALSENLEELENDLSSVKFELGEYL